jgi:hypothetical protein
MKKRIHNVGTVPKLTEKSYKEAKLISLTHIYMTSHLPGLVQALQYYIKWQS